MRGIAKKMKEIPDSMLQNSKFMHTFQGLVGGTLEADEDGQLRNTTTGQTMANEFLSQNSQKSWGDEFVGGRTRSSTMN